MRIVPLALVSLLFLVAACGGALPATAPLSAPGAAAAPAPAIPARGEYQHNGAITEKYDRFDKRTGVHLITASDALARRGRGGGLTVYYSYPGETPTPPSIVNIGFMSINDTWEFLSCYSLAFLVNDTDTISTDSTHDGDVLDGGKVGEIVTADLALDDFLRLVNAQKLEAKLCNDEFVLTDAQMASLRDVASRMQP